ncbi:MAG TPA: hypothetical protein VJL88_13310 [Nitrospira sp.]|nr:hypothetical protein [Nitrospira sp.]
MRINTEVKHVVNYGSGIVLWHATVLLTLLLALEACERQGPPPKPIGSATNRHVEDTPARPSRLDADAMIRQMQTPMEDARHTEGLLKGAAGRTTRQSDQTAP